MHENVNNMDSDNCINLIHKTERYRTQTPCLTSGYDIQYQMFKNVKINFSM